MKSKEALPLYNLCLKKAKAYPEDTGKYIFPKDGSFSTIRNCGGDSDAPKCLRTTARGAHAGEQFKSQVTGPHSPPGVSNPVGLVWAQ